MENIEFYAYPVGNDKGLDLIIETDSQRSLFVSPEDKAQLDRDWIERGYTRSSPVGTLFDTYFDVRTGETQLQYRLTEYKIYSGLAFPALPDTESLLLEYLRNSMRASAVGCVVETLDKKILAQRRKEGLSTGGMIDSGAAGMLVYDVQAGKLDWEQQTREKLKRELNLHDSDVQSLEPRSVFSSRGPVHIPAPKGYFTGCFSGMVGSYARVRRSSEEVQNLFSQEEVGNVIAIDKKDLSAFILENAVGMRGLNGDGCAALLSALPTTEFYDTIEKINSRDTTRIRFGYLKEGKFIEKLL